MKNITRLKCWPELKNLGFEPIRYICHGRTIAIGAAKRQSITDHTGKEFKTDLICIEPHNFSYSKDCYHLTGRIATPYLEKYHLYQFNQKMEFYQRKEFMNDFLKPQALLFNVKRML